MLVDVHVHRHVSVISVVAAVVAGAVCMEIVFAPVSHEVFPAAVVTVCDSVVVLLRKVEPAVSSSVVCAAVSVHNIRRVNVVIEAPVESHSVVAIIVVHATVVVHVIDVVHANVASITTVCVTHSVVTTLAVHVRHIV